MIAVDSSSMIGFLNGEEAEDVELVRTAINDEMLVLPPTVLTELLSDPNLKTDIADLVKLIPLIPLEKDFWVSVGEIRRKILQQGKKSRLADATIAVSCIQNNLPIITRDKDFRHYEEFGLRILKMNS